MENKNSLEQLRKEIDDIDGKIFSLLENRLDIVRQVGAYKNANDPNASIIRPGREAVMVKSIYNNALARGFSEKIALAFAVLWRNIISLSVNLEEKTVISLCSNNSEVKRLSREYFGLFTDIVLEEEPSNAVKLLNDGEVSIAVFEVEASHSKKPWWLHLLEAGDELSIFAGLPFFEKGDVSTITVAKISPESTGNDKFVYVVEVDVPLGLEVVSVFGDQKLCFSSKKLSSENAKYLGCFAVF